MTLSPKDDSTRTTTTRLDAVDDYNDDADDGDASGRGTGEMGNAGPGSGWASGAGWCVCGMDCVFGLFGDVAHTIGEL